MTKLLELDVIETDNEINYPEIPENYDGEICPYYFNRKCENSLIEAMKEAGERSVYISYLRYCPTNFENCLAYAVISVLDLLPDDLNLMVDSIPWNDLISEIKKEKTNEN